MFGGRNRRPRVTGYNCCIEASNDFHCLQRKKERKKEKKGTTNESRFFSARNFSGRRVKRGACYRQMYVQGVYDATLSLETFPPFLKLQREVFWESRKTIWWVTQRGEENIFRGSSNSAKRKR